ncbi:MAG: Cna B-type domain-containing protein [Eubacteriales bacterium]|nr:Cna B-type domain-containing protein [Eubacteriales bacterium]
MKRDIWGGKFMKSKLKSAVKKVFAVSITCLMIIGMIPVTMQSFAEDSGGKELSLDDVEIKSFKIIDVSNGNKEIEYKKESDADYVSYKNGPDKFKSAVCQNQKDSKIKLNLNISYKSDNPIQEGDTLSIPASHSSVVGNFSNNPVPIKNTLGKTLGTWIYKNGNFVLTFTGDFIKDNLVKEFSATFETGEVIEYSSLKKKHSETGKKYVEQAKLGKQDIIVPYEYHKINSSNIGTTENIIYKYMGYSTDSKANWDFHIYGDVKRLSQNGKDYLYFGPYLLEHDGKYSPNTLTDIYVEDTINDANDMPKFERILVYLSGIDDDGKVISGRYTSGNFLSLLKKIEQGSKTKEVIKKSLKSGEYCIFDNGDKSYTFMLKLWNMNDGNGMTYDKLPDVKAAGGVGNFLKKTNPDAFGTLSEATIERINKLHEGKAIQNVYISLGTPYVPVEETTEIENTVKITTNQTGEKDYNANGKLTPPSALAEVPSNPLTIKLIKLDVKTGAALSKGFKFELQTTKDNGATWKTVEVTQDMVEKGILNDDKAITPDDKGVIQIKKLIGGQKYRFVEKAHAAGYEDVKEDKDNPNTTKNPKSSNSRVVEISNQGTGKVVAMYNQPKAEKTEVKVTKAWEDKNDQDGKRPESVTIKLLADGEETGKTLTLTKADNWTGSFTDLDEYEAGKKIEYTIKEEAVGNGYTSVITGSAAEGYKVTNTREPEKIVIEGSKTWNDKGDRDGKRPAEITINLLKNGTKIDSVKVKESDGWKWKFENLDKYEKGNEITYTITEEKVEGYTTEVNGYNVKNSYTPGKTSIQVTKAWEDKHDQDGKRPASVTIKLLADGKEVEGKTLTLSKANNWTGSFTDLDEYKAGKKIEYTIKEEAVGNGYISVLSGNQKVGYTITNIRTPNTPPPVKPAPKTGDSANIALYIALFVLAGIFLAGAGLKKTKKNKI